MATRQTFRFGRQLGTDPLRFASHTRSSTRPEFRVAAANHVVGTNYLRPASPRNQVSSGARAAALVLATVAVRAERESGAPGARAANARAGHCRWPRRTGSRASSGAPGTRAANARAARCRRTRRTESGLRPAAPERELQLLRAGHCRRTHRTGSGLPGALRARAAVAGASRCRWPRRTGSTASSGAPGARATTAPCWPLSPDAEREAGLPERWERELQ